MPAEKFTTDKDANLACPDKKTLAVLGFGSQGHAHALNLKESGCNVIIGVSLGQLHPGREGRASRFTPPPRRSKRADVIMVGVPDTKQAAAYEKDIKPNLHQGQDAAVLHGFSIHFKTIVPPKNVNVIMVAPKGPGHIVRRQYTEGKGVPALIADLSEPARQAKQDRARLGQGHRRHARRRASKPTFKEETETDLFGEQTVLCGGASALVQAGFETLVEAGYPPEMAYFECLHELKLIVDLMNEAGIAGMRFSISETAKCGDLHPRPRIVDDRDPQGQMTQDPRGDPERGVRPRVRGVRTRPGGLS